MSRDRCKGAWRQFPPQASQDDSTRSLTPVRGKSEEAFTGDSDRKGDESGNGEDSREALNGHFNPDE